MSSELVSLTKSPKTLSQAIQWGLDSTHIPYCKFETMGNTHSLHKCDIHSCGQGATSKQRLKDGGKSSLQKM